MKRLSKYAAAALFFGFLFGFSAVNLLSPAEAFSPLENRYLAQRPGLSLDGLLDSGERGFARRFEQYVNDQFLLRDGWITLKSVAEAALGKTENNNIVYGSEGYLFEKYRSYDADRLEKNFVCLEEFAALYPGLQKYVMVVPDAYAVLTDKVPEGLGNVDQVPEISRIADRLSKSGYRPVDAVGALAAHRGEEIYYRTDHHWTTLGAWYGYSAFAEAAGFGVAAPDEQKKQSADGFWGTHFSKAKKFDLIPDRVVWYDFPVDEVTVDGQPKDGMYDLSRLEGRDKYALFLHANNGVTVIKNRQAPAKKLLIVKDSYANCLVPFLTRDYAAVTVADLRALPEGLGALIEREGFDEMLVLYGFSSLASDANLPRIRY